MWKQKSIAATKNTNTPSLFLRRSWHAQATTGLAKYNLDLWRYLASPTSKRNLHNYLHFTCSSDLALLTWRRNQSQPSHASFSPACFAMEDMALTHWADKWGWSSTTHALWLCRCGGFHTACLLAEEGVSSLKEGSYIWNFQSEKTQDICHYSMKFSQRVSTTKTDVSQEQYAMCILQSLLDKEHTCNH